MSIFESSIHAPTAQAPNQPGYYKGLSNEAYHSGPGISKSQLDLVRKSPSLLEWSKHAPEDEEKKTALNVGDAVHALLLEPDRFKSEFAIGPEDAPRNTNKGKAKWAEFEAGLKPGQVVLTAEEARKIQLIYGSVMAHPNARWLIEAEGDAEASIYWEDPDTGLLCRCRPDKNLISHGWMVDVKTTADMSKFARSVYDYRYYVQDPFYSEGFFRHFGEPLQGFLFLVVSTSIEAGKYPVRLFCLDPEAKAKGYQEMRDDLASVAECQRTGEFPGIETLSLPRWAA
ncbi:PD-(D/E)XK nuclease-like domain-containing protein [uncultured Marinobacter sp.]|uniref:PD-(D/E)XK nuclease-like domain-containing protein n=1 Tax=uncultured Marinobacter sp. TaxID=187379 RepID=UPI0030DA853E